MHLPHRNAEVDSFLDSLEHPRQVEVQQLRLAILAAEPDVTETIKWNAPNFRYAGEDRVTFRLQPRGRFQVVLHRGVHVRGDDDPVQVPDPEGLLTWLARDRAVITLDGAEMTPARLVAVTTVVGHWLRV